MRPPIPNGSWRSGSARGMEGVLPAATRWLAGFPKLFLSISTFRAVPLLQRLCCKVFLRCSNGRTQAPLRLENCFDVAVVPGGSDRSGDSVHRNIVGKAAYFLFTRTTHLRIFRCL